MSYVSYMSGMVAALTNKSAKSKSEMICLMFLIDVLYFAQCTSEMIFITHISAHEVESL
jgi:hypothetical protein